MKLKHFSYRKLLLWVNFFHLLTISSIQGQSWSIEYILQGDSAVYNLSSDKIIQGRLIDFFFPAYKFNQTYSMSAIESVDMKSEEMIELKFEVENISSNRIIFDIDLYAEGIDTIQFFIKTECDSLILLRQQYIHKDFTYLPTIHLPINKGKPDSHFGVKGFQITGKSKEQDRKLILGRLKGYKEIQYVANSEAEIDAFVSNCTFEKQSDIFNRLPDHYLKLHGFNWYTRLVLNDCISIHDSIRCINQYMNDNFMKYELYEKYHIDKCKLLKRCDSLAKIANSITEYYQNLKDIISLLNSCHMRLSTSKIDEIESPIQSIYFYRVNNKIVVSAIFDKELENKVELGDTLLSINDVLVDKLYRDFSTKVFASSPHQREAKITQKLLYLSREKWGDNLSIKLQNSLRTYTIYLQTSNFKSKKFIPNDFKILQGNVIEKYDDIVYFRPIFLESQLVPFIYSHKDNFINNKGLIIDLRNCSGGDYSFCTFLSYLITQENNILSCGSTQFNSFSNYLIRPSSKMHIKVPIVILVDARTACFSELMINALRKERHNVYVAGASNTAGSAQFILKTMLPENAVFVHFEGLTKDICGNVIDNNIGVVPDTLIHIESYKDLLPYKDKLKESALEYLKNI